MTPLTSIGIDSPLPRRFLTPDTGIGGRLKKRPDDFVVEEVPQYEPCGEGEHLYLWIQKHNVSHGELIATLRKTFKLPDRSIGFAGMKDKAAITRQYVSLHLHDDPPSVEIPHDRITVLNATRHTNKLRRGHLRGNRFSIRVRDVEPTMAPRALAVLRGLERTGAPCYYGEQRFGYRQNNHRLGALLLNHDYEAALAELLGSQGAAFPSYQKQRREDFDQGRLEEALRQWTPADRAELVALRSLLRKESPREVVRRIGHNALGFWASSFSSAIFNAVLDRRIELGTIGTLDEGDLAWKHNSGAVFRIGAEELEGPTLKERLESFEISPSGPRWGAGMIRADGVVDAVEREMLAAHGGSIELLVRAAYKTEGGRRPLRTPVLDPAVEGGVDDHGGYVQCAFQLSRGMYATVVLREVMKTEAETWRDREPENEDKPSDEKLA